MEKYENEEGQIAVLVSMGFGAGWSSWGDQKDFMAMDNTLVRMKLGDASEDEVKAYCKRVTGGEPHMGGWSDCEICWLEKGTAFTIEEYDGSESLRLISDLCMVA